MSRFLAGLLACLLAAAEPSMARTLEVGPGLAFALPSQAAAAARAGDRIVIAAGRYADCAVWRADDLIIEGAGAERTTVHEMVCQGKGIFVITGNNVTVRDLTLAGASVSDGNGAGIRGEGDGLLVERTRFLDNQNGILAAGRANSRIIVRDSEFLRNGSCARACAHGIYVGPAGLLRVERSRFAETREGHHIKSRALRTEVVDCDISDGAAGTASYLIDIPNGGGVLIRNNRLQKGPRAGNRSAAIAIGAEGVDRPTPEIRVEGNVFQADGLYATVFVANFTATNAVLVRNQITGRARPLRGDGSVAAVGSGAVARAAGMALHLMRAMSGRLAA